MGFTPVIACAIAWLTISVSADFISGTRVINGRTCNIQCNADRLGGDYDRVRTGTFEACIQAYAADSRCATAQYHQGNQYCYFKNARNPAVSDNNDDTVDCDSAPSTTTTASTTTTTTTTTTTSTTTTTTTTPVPATATIALYAFPSCATSGASPATTVYHIESQCLALSSGAGSATLTGLTNTRPDRTGCYAIEYYSGTSCTTRLLTGNGVCRNFSPPNAMGVLLSVIGSCSS